MKKYVKSLVYSDVKFDFDNNEESIDSIINNLNVNWNKCHIEFLDRSMLIINNQVKGSVQKQNIFTLSLPLQFCKIVLKKHNYSIVRPNIMRNCSYCNSPIKEGVACLSISNGVKKGSVPNYWRVWVHIDCEARNLKYSNKLFKDSFIKKV